MAVATLSRLKRDAGKDMKPSDISPATMKVMPMPRSPSGTSEYFIFWRRPAMATMASSQPSPEPAPYTTDSIKS